MHACVHGCMGVWLHGHMFVFFTCTHVYTSKPSVKLMGEAVLDEGLIRVRIRSMESRSSAITTRRAEGGFRALGSAPSVHKLPTSLALSGRDAASAESAPLKLGAPCRQKSKGLETHGTEVHVQVYSVPICAEGLRSVTAPALLEWGLTPPKHPHLGRGVLFLALWFLRLSWWLGLFSAQKASAPPKPGRRSAELTAVPAALDCRGFESFLDRFGVGLWAGRGRRAVS